MVDREVFDRRLARLETLLHDLRVLAGRDAGGFLSDRGLQAQAERWAHLAVECCLDLANHLIAGRGWQTPESYRDVFRILRSHGVIDEALATHMAAWAGLRNLLVHLYLDVDYKRLFKILAQDLDQIEAFAKAVGQEADRNDD